MVAQHYRWDFVGLSTDNKPTPETSEKVVDGSTFYCSDTSKLYVFCKDTWYERKALGGGGGGGTTYTAGDGIDITDDTISVDTDTIQEKLTAGTGIDITGSTISATGGGGGPTVVQTTGTSTTDVMSQNATTSMIFADPADKTQVQIGSASQSNVVNTILIGNNNQAENTNAGVILGNGCSVSGNRSIALGRGAVANARNSVAFSGSQATQQGQFDISLSSDPSGGYNNTNYRLITGLHDGQSSHDAVTVNQINALIDAINSATNSSIPHIGS